MLDKDKFRSAIMDRGDRQEDAALALGMSPSMLSGILNGRREFRRNEIELVAEHYKLSLEEIRRIFFTGISNQNLT